MAKKSTIKMKKKTVARPAKPAAKASRPASSGARGRKLAEKYAQAGAPWWKGHLPE